MMKQAVLTAIPMAFASCALALGVASTTYAAPSPVDGLPICEYEDGSPGGAPCVWVNSEGRLYFNDSSNYRR